MIKTHGKAMGFDHWYLFAILVTIEEVDLFSAVLIFERDQ